MIRSSKFTKPLLAMVMAVAGMTAMSANAADKITVQLKWLPQASSLVITWPLPRATTKPRVWT